MENIYTPIDFLGPMAPEGLLKLISGSCKTDCNSNRCSCVRANLKCLSACTTCRGITCENADVCIEDDESDRDDEKSINNSTDRRLVCSFESLILCYYYIFSPVN